MFVTAEGLVAAAIVFAFTFGALVGHLFARAEKKS